MSSIFMVLIVALIMTEIVLRAVTGGSTLVASEYSGYFLVALTVLGFAYTLKDEAHIRITLVHSRLSPSAQRVLDIFVALVALGVTIYACTYAVDMVYDSYALEMTADTISETELWIPQTVVPLGLAMLGLQLVAYIIKRVTDDK
ncbi:MAG: TRAP transporter small permease subunit [Desulfovibrio sp.]